MIGGLRQGLTGNLPPGGNADRSERPSRLDRSRHHLGDEEATLGGVFEDCVNAKPRHCLVQPVTLRFLQPPRAAMLTSNEPMSCAAPGFTL